MDSKPKFLRMNAMIKMTVAIPENRAPVTKYGPSIVECHIGRTVIPNTHETTE